MGFKGWGHSFQGPVALPDYLSSGPGVFIVWCVHQGTWDILDAGDADNVRTFLLLRNHLEEYGASRPYKIYFSASYMVEPKERLELLKLIKGPSFVPSNIDALKAEKSHSEHDKLFGSGKPPRTSKRRHSKIPVATVVPGRFVQTLTKRIKELEGGKEKRGS